VGANPRGPYSLVVFQRGDVRNVPLPSSGSITLGRADDNDVVVPDASVSRKHARLTLDQSLTIEDLGSANGTMLMSPNDEGSERTEGLRERRLPPNQATRLAVGQPVQLGSVVVVVRPADSPALPRALPGVVVSDPAMKRLYDLVDRVAPGSLSVIVVGETGVGKEILAEAIHARSPRASGPMVRINCAALAESLLESELFGFERGAFTGAQKEKIGLIESADGGTMMLDEVGELPLGLQAKLLRVLEDKKVLPVGGLRPRAVDVRFIAATHRDLRAEIAKGRFRQDLYYRLNGVTIAVPPLRERRGEIVPLADAFIAQAAAEMGRKAPSLAPDAREQLLSHDWPGNVRELRNAVHRATLVCDGTTIHAADLGVESGAPPPAPSTAVLGGDAQPDASLGDDIATLEKRRIMDALEKCAGNQTRAASLLGISRRTLVSRLREYGIRRPRSRSGS
jgi:two-component system response regulator AtoC